MRGFNGQQGRAQGGNPFGIPGILGEELPEVLFFEPDHRQVHQPEDQPRTACPGPGFGRPPPGPRQPAGSPGRAGCEVGVRSAEGQALVLGEVPRRPGAQREPGGRHRQSRPGNGRPDARTRRRPPPARTARHAQPCHEIRVRLGENRSGRSAKQSAECGRAARTFSLEHRVRRDLTCSRQSPTAACSWSRRRRPQYLKEPP